MAQGIPHGTALHQPGIEFLGECRARTVEKIQGGTDIVTNAREEKTTGQAVNPFSRHPAVGAARLTGVGENQQGKPSFSGKGRQPSSLELAVGKEKAAERGVRRIVIRMAGKVEKISLGQMTFDEGTGGLPALEKHFHPRDIGAGEHPPYGNPFLPRGCQVSLRVRHDENLLGGGIQFSRGNVRGCRMQGRSSHAVLEAEEGFSVVENSQGT